MIISIYRELALFSRKIEEFILLPKLEGKARRLSSLGFLLLSFSWPADRKRMLEDYELSPDQLKPWLICADLCRIKGMRHDLAQIIALDGGIDSVQALAKANKTTLTSKIIKGFETHGLDNPPTEAEIGNIISRAKKLHARVIWNAADSKELKSTLQGFYYRHLYLDLYTTFNFLKVTFSVLIALFICYCCMAICLLLTGPLAEKPLYILGVINAVALGLELIALVLFNFLYPYYLNWLTDVNLPQKLAQDRNTRLVFITVLNRDVDWIYAISQKIVSPLFAFVAIVLLFLIGFGREFLPAYFEPSLFYFLISIIVLLIVLYVLPDFLTMRKDLPTRNLPLRALTKYMLHKLIAFIKYLFQFAIFYYSVIGLLAFHQLLASKILAPLYFSPVDAIEYFGLYTVQGWQLDLGNTIIQIIIWSIGLIAVLSFLVPYLLLRKPKEVILFLLLTLAANRTEDFLTSHLSAYINLPSGTIFTVIVLIGAILFNAAVFETLEDASDDIQDGESLKLCRACFKTCSINCKLLSTLWKE